MRLTPAEESSPTENDFPLIPTMKLTGFDTAAQTAPTARQGQAGRGRSSNNRIPWSTLGTNCNLGVISKGPATRSQIMSLSGARDLDMRSAEPSRRSFYHRVLGLEMSPFCYLAERRRSTLSGDLLAFPHQGRELLIEDPGGAIGRGSAKSRTHRLLRA